MRIPAGAALTLGLVAWFAFGMERSGADEPSPGLTPSYGAVKLKAGFEPDPFAKKLVAGGPIKTKLGGVTAHVAKEPDFKLNYTAGDFILRIFVESKGDTTLLINLPDKSWRANDDSGPGKNAEITFKNPQSGQYDIWVGTIGTKNVDATLKITEHGPTVAVGPKVKTITLIDVNWFEAPRGKNALEMRVYDVGNGSQIFKTRRTENQVWRLNPGPWAVQKGVRIQFWEINSGLGETDRKIGSMLVEADMAPGVYTRNFKLGTTYDYTLKYRIDN